jgi:sedoheptulokinase
MRLGGAGGNGQHHGVDYRALNELAAEELETLEAAGRDIVYDPDLPRVDTRFQGTRTDPGARASISNLTPWNFTPGAIALGLLSGMIEELHQLFSLLPAEVRRDTHRLRLTGNALRRNEVLRRLAGIHFQVPTSVPDYTEEAAVGAAVIAGVGTGVWPSYEAACRTVG